MLRVNVGCGMTPTRGWRNFDNSFSLKLAQHGSLSSMLGGLGLLSGPQREYVEFCRRERIEWADASRRLPLPDASVEVLYSSHMLEHLDPEDARRFLGEARRLLAPGGILRVSVPDLARHVADYSASGDADAFVERAHMCVPRPKSLVARLKFFVVGPRHHQWMYDGRSLRRLLKTAGFSDPVVVEAGRTTIADPGALDLAERSDESVYVEAGK